MDGMMHHIQDWTPNIRVQKGVNTTYLVGFIVHTLKMGCFGVFQECARLGANNGSPPIRGIMGVSHHVPQTPIIWGISPHGVILGCPD